MQILLQVKRPEYTQSGTLAAEHSDAGIKRRTGCSVHGCSIIFRQHMIHDMYQGQVFQ